MISKIVVCSRDLASPVNKVPESMYQDLFAATRDMILTKEGRFETVEIYRQDRTNSWKAGSYLHDDEITLSDPKMEDWQQFRASFGHCYPQYEKYSVEFRFLREKFVWLPLVLDLLEKNQVEAVKIVYDDNTVGKFLSDHWASTFWVPLTALRALLSFATEMSTTLNKFSMESIWVNGCIEDKRTEKETRLALFSLIGSILRCDAADINKRSSTEIG